DPLWRPGRPRLAASVPGARCTPRHKSCSSTAPGEVFISLPGGRMRQTMQVELDRGDLRILDVLQQHGDLSAADVAERGGMTASTCWRSSSRLQELGVLKQRGALVDREKIGLNVLVFSHVKLSGHGRDALLKFEQAVREHPEILDCYTL